MEGQGPCLQVAGGELSSTKQITPVYILIDSEQREEHARQLWEQVGSDLFPHTRRAAVGGGGLWGLVTLWFLFGNKHKMGLFCLLGPGLGVPRGLEGTSAI